MTDDKRPSILAEYRRPLHAPRSKEWRIADPTLLILLSATGERIVLRPRRKIVRY